MAENLSESAFRDWFLATMKPELVSPLVALLAHQDCPVSGEFFVVGGGRVARTVMVETHGYVNRESTPEDILAHMPDIMSDSRHYFPAVGESVVKYSALALGYDMGESVSVAAKVPS